MAQISLEFRLVKLVLLFILLLLLVPPGYFLYSEYRFNRAIALIEETNRRQIYDIEDSDRRGNELARSVSEILESYEDRNRVDAEITRVRNLIDELMKAQEEYVTYSEETVKRIQSFVDTPLWVSSSKREFVSEIHNLLLEEWKEIKDYQDNDYPAEQATVKALIDWIEDFALFLYTNSLSDRELQDTDYMLTLLEPYKEYANKSFALENENLIKTKYPTSYSYLKNSIDYYANFYKYYLFLSSGDGEAAEGVYRELVKQEDLLSEDAFNNFLEEITELDKEKIERDIERTYRYMGLVQRYEDDRINKGVLSDGKLLWGKRRNAAHIIANAIELYADEHEDKFPETESVDDLYEILEGYLAGIDRQFLLEDINYSSDGETYYSIKYEEEKTGEKRERKYEVFN